MQAIYIRISEDLIIFRKKDIEDVKFIVKMETGYDLLEPKAEMDEIIVYSIERQD